MFARLLLSRPTGGSEDLCCRNLSNCKWSKRCECLHPVQQGQILHWIRGNCQGKMPFVSCWQIPIRLGVLTVPVVHSWKIRQWCGDEELLQLQAREISSASWRKDLCFLCAWQVPDRRGFDILHHVFSWHVQVSIWVGLQMQHLPRRHLPAQRTSNFMHFV